MFSFPIILFFAAAIASGFLLGCLSAARSKETRPATNEFEQCDHCRRQLHITKLEYRGDDLLCPDCREPKPTTKK